MTRARKAEVYVLLLVIVVAVSGALIRWQRSKPISLRGAVLVENSDPRKQLPISGVMVTTGDLGSKESNSDASGYFSLKLPRLIRRGHNIVLHFRHPQYRPLDLKEVISDQLYIIHLIPISTNPPAPQDAPQIKVSNVRVRYTVDTMSAMNVGSAVKTFEVNNQGNVPCQGRYPCSPDGKWKASTAQVSLDAGESNEFRDIRASCIAGPCPFTKIESSVLSRNGQTMVVTARDWSDPAVFLVQAEVFHPMVSPVAYWSYPVIFGDGLSFTLPSSAESVSMEADLNGQTIIFPLGPSLTLSWATCASGVNPDKGTVYRCASKPGYRFQ